MGNQQRKERERKLLKNKKIDERLQKEYRKRPINLLILGTGDSGKTTLIKQIQIIYNNGFSDSERERFKTAIETNYVKYTKELIKIADALGLKFTKNNQSISKKVLATKVERLDYKQKKLRQSIKKLWAGKALKQAFQERDSFQIPDTFGYFLDEIDRCTSRHYVPTDQDVLNCRIPTTGVNTVNFTIANFPWQLTDVGGQRSERRKWIDQFENVTAVIFIVAISEYNQNLYENQNVNRMKEALELFDEIVNNDYFYQTLCIILFNKLDLFEEKVKKVPITGVFPDFELREGDDVFTASMNHIIKTFVEIGENDERDIIPLTSTAIETDSIQRVFDEIQSKVLEDHLKRLDML